jgi:hypothetical protein
MMLQLSWGEIKSQHMMGYVKIDDRNYPFFLSDQVLLVIPPTTEELNEQRAKLFSLFTQPIGERKREWQPVYPLEGELDSGNRIQFLAHGNPSNRNGFLQYEIVQLISYNPGNADLNHIESIILESEAIDAFYNPSRAFQTEFFFVENKTEKCTVSITNPIAKELGHYTHQDVVVTLSVRAYANVRLSSEMPMKARSELIIDFSQPVSWKFANEAIELAKSFLVYIVSRTNVYFSDIAICHWEDGKRRSFGNITIAGHPDPENSPKRMDAVIKQDVIDVDISPLFQAIERDEISFDHLCGSIDERKLYGINRVILLFAAFEREYRNLFGDELTRSEKYYEIKAEVLAYLQDRQNQTSGKQKSYFQAFRKIIDNSDNSFAERFKIAIYRISKCIEPFWVREYNRIDDEQIEETAVRLNTVRNDLAHGNLSEEYEPIHLSDWRIIEITLYMVRLLSIGLPEDNVMEAINDLFNYNFALEKDA